MIIFEVFNFVEKKKEVVCWLYGVLNFFNYDYCYIKVRVWCELSKLLFKCNNLFEIIKIDREEIEKIIECWCFKEVIKLCFNYFFVFWDYGIYLRYIMNFEKLKEMLEKVV